MLDARLEDLAVESDAYNYSLSLGVSHPRTTIDIQTVAHVANGRNAMSSGIVLNYMTAHRKQTNMALLAKIDKLKNSLNLQVNICIYLLL